ncbi:hypothetical protein QAD02_021675 [Eretmocerus hayati]|uniref:Uncharacterized protein n=1 Tax=Eretmocerus hayati TaxID=131215 RepID=A0ACC2PR54_9HYME|nr:hypothetical protein QAD02_021675 [Eretmocerus hayati]
MGKDLTRTREELAKAHAELSIEEAKYKKLENRLIECFQDVLPSSKRVTGDQSIHPSSSNSTLSLMDDQSLNGSGTGTMLNVEGNSRKKKQRPVRKKGREQFPLPTTYTLDHKIKAIVDNPKLPVKEVVNEALPLMFSEEEPRSSCLFGRRKIDKELRDKDEEPKDRPPLDPDMLNALMRVVFGPGKVRAADSRTTYMFSPTYDPQGLQVIPGWVDQAELPTYVDPLALRK